MRKVFHFDSPRTKYHCDAAVVWCFDNRFDLGFRKFLKRCGIKNPDPIKVAGGAKLLASPEQESDREFLLDQIRTSIRLHGTRHVILMTHSDCGAYGGLEQAFGGDAAAERIHLKRELGAAANIVSQNIADVGVSMYYVDFEGVWDAGGGIAEDVLA